MDGPAEGWNHGFSKKLRHGGRGTTSLKYTHTLVAWILIGGQRFARLQSKYNDFDLLAREIPWHINGQRWPGYHLNRADCLHR